MSRDTSRVLLLIVLLGAVARVAAWWFKGGFHYPDEIFQLVEPAHFLRTGVAWLPWEFSRGVRSWVLPGYYAGVLECLSWGGITGLSAYRFITLQNALFTLVMIPAGYRMGAALCNRGDAGAERAGLLVAFLFAAWPMIVYYTPHTLIGTPTMVLMCWGWAHWLEARRSDADAMRSVLWCGFFFGMAGALRFTTGFHMLVPIADLLIRFRARGLVRLVAGAAVPTLIIGFVDWLTWGQWFHSTVEHLKYNFFEGGASDHGTSPWYFYFTDTSSDRFGLLAPLAWLVALAGIKRTWLIALTLLVPTITLSIIAHKEDRFLMYNWPLIAVMLAFGLLSLERWLRPRLRAATVPAVAVLALALIGSNLAGASEMRWTWRRGIFRAQDFVGSQPDVTGLLLHDRMHMNGGYLVFGQTVPQRQHTRSLAANPWFNYAALEHGGAGTERLRGQGWTEIARFDEFVVLKRPPQAPR